MHEGAATEMAERGRHERENRRPGLQGRQGLQDNYLGLFRDLWPSGRRQAGGSLFQPGRWIDRAGERGLILVGYDEVGRGSRRSAIYVRASWLASLCGCHCLETMRGWRNPASLPIVSMNRTGQAM